MTSVCGIFLFILLANIRHHDSGIMWYSEDIQMRILQPLQKLAEQKTKWSYEERQHVGTAWGSECRQTLTCQDTSCIWLSAMALSHLTYPTGNYWCWRLNVKKNKGMGHEVFQQGLFFCDIAIWLKPGKFKQRRDSLSTFPFVLSMQRFHGGWCHQDLTLGEMRAPVDQIPFIPNLQHKYFRLIFPIVLTAISWEGFLYFFTKTPPFCLLKAKESFSE